MSDIDGPGARLVAGGHTGTLTEPPPPDIVGRGARLVAGGHSGALTEPPAPIDVPPPIVGRPTVYPTIRLEAPGLDPLVIDRAAGYWGQKLDLGDPITRAVAADAPDADGTDDTTAYTGARNVTLSVVLSPDTGSPWALRQALNAFRAPKLRPYMYVQTAADAPEQRIMLRRSSLSDVIGDGLYDEGTGIEAAVVTVQWVAPLGTLESAVEHTATVYAVADGVVVGRTYPLTFDRIYPASPVLGSATLVNAGVADAYPIIRIYGPVTEPVLDNNTQGRSLIFVDLTLAADEYLEIDTRAHTILLNGDPTNSRYDKADFGVSRWFTLSSGANEIRFHPATFTESVTAAVFTWRDAS
jgi:hypothetical protein